MLLAGCRIGEAQNPGPGSFLDCCLDDSDAGWVPQEEGSDLEVECLPELIDDDPWHAEESEGEDLSLHETWMGDSGFPEDLLHAWQAAEKDLNISNRPRSERKTGTGESKWQWIDGQDFVKEPTFRGPRPGFTFKTGESGTGYYNETAGSSGSTVPMTILLDELISSSWCTPSLMHQQAEELQGRRRRARRARFPDGRRKPKKSRKPHRNYRGHFHGK